jgi:nitrate reductase NapAB chaperone NapD
VTLEAGDDAAIADAIVRLQTLPGVLAAALVYQHSESASDMDAEVDLEDHAPNLR